MTDEQYQQHADRQDQEDKLSAFSKEFLFPQVNGRDAIYFCGNSLGLQPVTARTETEKVFKDWETMGVEGHFHGDNPWTTYHKKFREPVAEIVGAKPEEVVVMNNLTVNLHLGMVSFYRPQGKKFKIIMEGHAFPSDQYAVESQVRFHGYDPEEAIVEIHPAEGSETLETAQIIRAIEDHAAETALLLLGGLQYYTGQVFEMEKICKAARENNVRIGLDLAHAAGNVLLSLHQWEADFAVWCSYKYLNSGPGAVSGMFIHEKHHKDTSLPRFAGWWGHNEQARFKMEKGFDPIPSADGWQLSNSAILNMAAHYASLQIFRRAGMVNLREKSKKLTAFLEVLMSSFDFIKIITPADPEQRGCQLSFYVEKHGKKLFEYIQEQGVIADWREPNVIRIAPAPLYNSFRDVFDFYRIIKNYDQQQGG